MQVQSKVQQPDTDKAKTKQANNNNAGLSHLLRTALAEFLAAPVPPPHLAPVFDLTLLPKRTRSVNLTIKPNQSDQPTQLRPTLDAYATTHNLTVSAVLRRAMYEYTKPLPPNQPDPTATLDAWGDSTKT
jgi:hypothetical protein